jgi:hypothetical protein
MAKQPVDPAKAKEAKQKKIAIGGAVVLVILLAIQGPKVMKQMGRSSAPPPAPPTTIASPASPTPVATTPATGVDPTGGTGGSGLISETAPTAALGQVSSFGRFASKDPFAAIPGSTSQPADSGGGDTGGGSEPPAKPPAPPAPPKSSGGGGKTLTSAVIAVNGVKELVSVGANFPAANPLFHLVSVSDHSVKISVAGGALANGEGSVTLKEGEPVTLMNTSDGTRYKIQLYPQGTKITAPTSTSTGAAAPTTSTPATTTTSTSGN